MPVKKAAAKPAPKKAAAKPAPKKAAPAKKAEPAKKAAPDKKAAPSKKPAAAKPAKKEAPKKAGPSANASYHLSKRSDGLWQVFLTGSDKVIKTFKTKAEADVWLKEKSANTGRSVLSHNSKGANKGKIKKK